MLAVLYLSAPRDHLISLLEVWASLLQLTKYHEGKEFAPSRAAAMKWPEAESGVQSGRR